MASECIIYNVKFESTLRVSSAIRKWKVIHRRSMSELLSPNRSHWFKKENLLQIYLLQIKLNGYISLEKMESWMALNFPFINIGWFSLYSHLVLCYFSKMLKIQRIVLVCYASFKIIYWPVYLISYRGIILNSSNHSS